MSKGKKQLIIAAAMLVSFLGTVATARLIVQAQQPGAPKVEGTATPSVGPSDSPPIPRPVDPLGATPPPPPPDESRIDANRRVIEALGPDRKVELTDGVIAVLTFGLPEAPTREILLYDLRTGAQLFIDLDGVELRRYINDPDAERRIIEVLSAPVLLERALSLGR